MLLGARDRGMVDAMLEELKGKLEHE
jgi:hypothetical protein